jgi:glycerol-3-phosphate dehydrogenase
VVNYCGVTEFIKHGKQITGVKVKDQITGNEYGISGKVVINATGVFADEVLQLAEGNQEKTIAPSQGIHLVVAKHFFKGSAGLMIPKTDDGRVLFAMPWHDKLLLGTTDTPVANITTEPKPLKAEIDFVIEHFNRYTASTINYSDVLSVFVGLRPLAKSGNAKKTAVMPRDHHIVVLPSGLVHVTGGKWTTYRSMAEHAVDKALQSVGLVRVACKTSSLAIHGCTKNKDVSYMAIYGCDAAAIQLLMDADVALLKQIHPAYPYTLAEVKWMMAEEMAITVEDILARRIRLLFLDAKAAMEAAPLVANFMATQNGENEQWEQEQVQQFIALAKGYLVVGDR